MPKAAGKTTFGAIIGIFSSLFYCFSVFYAAPQKVDTERWKTDGK